MSTCIYVRTYTFMCDEPHSLLALGHVIRKLGVANVQLGGALLYIHIAVVCIYALYVRIYTCIYVCICICMYICIYMYICMYMYLYIYMYMYIYIYIYIYIYMCVCVFMYLGLRLGLPHFSNSGLP